MAVRSLLFLSLSVLAGSSAAAESAQPALLSSGTVNLGDWSTAYAKAKAFVSGLSDDEKISIITGSSAGNFSALQFKDGFQSIEGYYYVSGFADASALAFSWDRDLMYEQSAATAQEFYGKGFQVINGPTSEPLGRTPWGGRLVETLGQDPYLNGIMFGKSVSAYTKTGIIAGGKHFLLNEQETNRSSSGMGSSSSSSSSAPYSANADDKTIHESYLWPFYDGVKAGMGAVMCAMNKVNGSLSCENSALLNDLLKTELGFPGLVYPDVNAQSTALGSANGGLDYGSSSLWSNSTLVSGITNGTFTQARLDDMVIRNVIGYYHVELDNGNQPSLAGETEYRDVRGNHSKIIRKVGGESMVLLKNTNGALPLNKPLAISIFGAHAGPVMGGPNQALSVQGSGPVYAGHLAAGSGSALGSFPYLVTPQHALTAQAMEDGTMIRWILNDTYTSYSGGGAGGGMGAGMGGGDMPTMGSNSSSSSASSSAQPSGAPSGGNMTDPSSSDGGASGGGASAGGSTNLGNLGSGTSANPSFANYAADSSVCMVFINALAGEGADRTELYNTDQDAMIISVAANCNNTIVVVNTVGARLVDQWIENENVTAVVYGSLLGQESGNSIVDVLYGKVNPSGKLPYTIAKNESDYDVGICYTAECDFTEGNYIDYKSFDYRNVTPRYEFGYGMSYTTFSYSNISIAKTGNSSALSSPYPTGPLEVGGYADLWDEVMTVSLSIRNTGSVDGAEVAQLYLEYPTAAGQPIRQLRGFEKVAITAQSSGSVQFSLRRRDISAWDVEAQQWRIYSGTYKVHVGASSRDLRASSTFTV